VCVCLQACELQEALKLRESEACAAKEGVEAMLEAKDEEVCLLLSACIVCSVGLYDKKRVKPMMETAGGLENKRFQLVGCHANSHTHTHSYTNTYIHM